MCDRTRTSRAASQINFIEFVVAPIYAQVGCLVSYSSCITCFGTLQCTFAVAPVCAQVHR